MSHIDENVRIAAAAQVERVRTRLLKLADRAALNGLNAAALELRDHASSLEVVARYLDRRPLLEPTGPEADATEAVWNGADAAEFGPRVETLWQLREVSVIDAETA